MQNERKKTTKQSWDMGYYIALILCVVAVGVSGYLFTVSLSTETPEAETHAPSLNAALPHIRAQAEPTEPALPVAVPHLPTQTEPTETETEQTPATEAAVCFTTVVPVNGALTVGYSMDHLSYNPTTRDWRTHDGVDYQAEPGTQVLAAADGVVEAIYEDDFFGMTVTIRHSGGFLTRYANLDPSIPVAAGEEVRAGSVIGTVGSTALLEINAEPHLHFAVSKDGVSVDPEAFLSGALV